MWRVLVAVMLALGPAHAGRACEVGASRCRDNVVEACWGKRWRPETSCKQALVCVEEVPGRAECVEPGTRARIKRAVSRGAAYTLIVAFVITRAIRGR